MVDFPCLSSRVFRDVSYNLSISGEPVGLVWPSGDEDEDISGQSGMHHALLTTRWNRAV